MLQPPINQWGFNTLTQLNTMKRCFKYSPTLFFIFPKQLQAVHFLYYLVAPLKKPRSSNLHDRAKGLQDHSRKWEQRKKANETCNVKRKILGILFVHMFFKKKNPKIRTSQQHEIINAQFPHQNQTCIKFKWGKWRTLPTANSQHQIYIHRSSPYSDKRNQHYLIPTPFPGPQ